MTVTTAPARVGDLVAVSVRLQHLTTPKLKWLKLAVTHDASLTGSDIQEGADYSNASHVLWESKTSPDGLFEIDTEVSLDAFTDTARLPQGDVVSVRFRVEPYPPSVAVLPVGLRLLEADDLRGPVDVALVSGGISVPILRPLTASLTLSAATTTLQDSAPATLTAVFDRAPKSAPRIRIDGTGQLADLQFSGHGFVYGAEMTPSADPLVWNSIDSKPSRKR
ncbi:MAG: hypothetical protein HY303_02415 [Candidatus Wallbacteria bacterium]|nr:hypothetical protein [Candidatus Wallbacteria bacterium]